MGEGLKTGELAESRTFTRSFVDERLTNSTPVLYYLPSHTTGQKRLHEGRLRARHSPQGQGGDAAASPPEGQPRPDRRPRPVGEEDGGGRRLPAILRIRDGPDLGTSPVSPRERRRARRRRAALPPGLRGGALVPAESQRPRRGDGTRHGLCPPGRSRKAVPRRGRSRLRPAERGARVPEPSRRRGGRQVPRLRRGADVQDARSD